MIIHSYGLKKQALNRLKGNWLVIISIIAVPLFLAFLLNMVVSMANYDYDVAMDNLMWQYYNAMANGNQALMDEIWNNMAYLIAPSFWWNLFELLAGIIVMAFVVPINMSLLHFCKGNKVSIKDYKFTLRFAWDSFVLNFLVAIRVFLWSLLLVIPGIIKAISYSQAGYIKAETPSKSSKQCIMESEIIMHGNKATYFIFGLSFLGWLILGSLVQTLIFSFMPEHIVIRCFLMPLIGLCIDVCISVYFRVSITAFYFRLNGSEMSNYGNTNIPPKSNPYNDNNFDNQNSDKEDKVDDSKDIFGL